ncbi:putative membrane protein [Babesia divergens]|uniref:Membrane protein n=1 Tax=Babesia divergens TaxID=32595 RepID=A0AAD9GJ31_BABDI|nr:putative membrane protein [Babesia divergens]
MLAHSLVLYICILVCLQVYAKKVQHCGRYTLSALGGSGVQERTFQRRWRLNSSLVDELDAKIRRELVRLASKLPGVKGMPLKDPNFLIKEAKKVQRIIVPERQDLYLNKYWAVEKIERLGFLGDVFEWLFGPEDYVTYSAWQYRPNIFKKGGAITLELHYKIPINIGGGHSFFFEPIVVYTCDVSPGKYVPGSARFASGTVDVLTHPFLPWRRFQAGSFDITPPHLPTVFSP